MKPWTSRIEGWLESDLNRFRNGRWLIGTNLGHVKRMPASKLVSEPVLGHGFSVAVVKPGSARASGREGRVIGPSLELVSVTCEKVACS